MKEEDPLKLSKKLGTVLKKRRKERGIGLQELADMSSVSKLTLINIEKGEANPSLSIMWKLANSLQIPISSLLEEEKSITISRSGKGYQMLSANEACTLETAFHTSHSGKIEVHRAFLKPGGSYFSESHQSGVIEYVTVMKGTAAIMIGEEIIELKQWDSVSFTADVEHGYVNRDQEGETVLHFVMTYSGSTT